MNIMATIFDFNGSGRLGRVKIYTKGAVNGQNIHMTKHLIFLYQQGRWGIHCIFKGERLFWSYERRNFPQWSLANQGTNTYRFWFPPRWTSFIWRVKVSFASFHWRRRCCSCVLDKVVQLALISNLMATWVANMIWKSQAILHQGKSNLTNNFAQNNSKALLPFRRFESIFWWRVALLGEISELNFEGNSTKPTVVIRTLTGHYALYVAGYDSSAPHVLVFAGSHCQQLLNKLIFIGYLLISGNAVKRN